MITAEELCAKFDWTFEELEELFLSGEIYEYCDDVIIF